MSKYRKMKTCRCSMCGVLHNLNTTNASPFHSLKYQIHSHSHFLHHHLSLSLLLCILVFFHNFLGIYFCPSKATSSLPISLYIQNHSHFVLLFSLPFHRTPLIYSLQFTLLSFLLLLILIANFSATPLKMKKFILKLEVEDGRDKRKAMKIVSTLSGIDMISMDMKDKKLTITGTVDPVSVVSKLRKFWKSTAIISVGPAKEPEKKEEPKKEEPKKEEAKKEEPKKEDGKEEPKKEEGKEEVKKEEAKKEEPKKGEEPKKEEGEKKTEQPQPMVAKIMPYRPYYPPGTTYYPPLNTYYPAMNTYYPPPPVNTYYNPPINTNYYAQPVVEESPSTCVIC